MSDNALQMVSILNGQCDQYLKRPDEGACLKLTVKITNSMISACELFKINFTSYFSTPVHRYTDYDNAKIVAFFPHQNLVRKIM